MRLDLNHASADGMLPTQRFSERAIDLIHGDSVISLDVRSQCAETAAGRRILYCRLILACGAEPKRLPAPGGNDVAYLRSLPDAESLRRAAIEAESAIVIGAGFIGCEAAD
ncbi:FAD-dependent oxidoreductase [Rhodococcus sp. NPDC056506]|uniref:FAD-dependent oxidoreductase n=1 Tax=Rhodococcus sp. NPDC056506 TaxID=3345844 RepID=UPI003670F7A7